MPRITPMVHPRMLESHAARFPERVTIQQGTAGRDAFGQPTTTWAAAPGIPTAIPAVIEPLSGVEIRGTDLTYAIGTFKIALNGAYPTIAASQRLVDSTGQAYDILDPSVDGRGVETQVVARIVV